jgi:hypothetical protein
VPLLCLWRSHYVSRPRVAPLPYKVGPLRVPEAVTSLIFAKRTFLPSKYSKYIVRILVPVLYASILLCFAVFGMAIACALGMWGSGVTGRSCTSAAGTKIPNCDAMQGSCDPLDPSECLLPFPSSFLLVNDSTTKTGKRVYIRPEIMVPLNGGGPSLLNPEAWNQKDGFRQVKSPTNASKIMDFFRDFVTVSNARYKRMSMCIFLFFALKPFERKICFRKQRARYFGSNTQTISRII